MTLLLFCDRVWAEGDCIMKKQMKKKYDQQDKTFNISTSGTVKNDYYAGGGTDGTG